MAALNSRIFLFASVIAGFESVTGKVWIAIWISTAAFAKSAFLRSATIAASSRRRPIE